MEYWKDECKRVRQTERERERPSFANFPPPEPHMKQAIIPIITSPSLILIVRTPLLLLISDTCLVSLLLSSLSLSSFTQKGKRGEAQAAAGSDS